MSNPSELVEVKVSTDAASNFVETYYPALNSEEGRKGITKFYIKPSAEATAEADISYNGNVMANPAELQELFEKQITSAYYKVDTFDCEVINSNYNVGADSRQLAPDKEGRKLSIMVVVGGTVKYGDDGESRVFTENIVLVPNWEAQGPKAAKGLKKFLIQSQNFRLLL